MRDVVARRYPAMPPETQLTALATAAGLVVIWLANLFGLWWVTPLAGLVIGLALRRARAVFLSAVLAGALGWGAPLAWQALSLPIGAASSTVAGIMGFGASNGALIVVATLLLGAIYCAAGAWVGLALRRLVPAPAAPHATPAERTAPAQEARVSPNGRTPTRRAPARRRKRR